MLQILSEIFWAGLPFVVIAALPLFYILLSLLINQQAGFKKNGNLAAVCCGDMRVYRVFAIFGGASAFTFGMHWAFIAAMVGPLTLVGRIASTYAVMQCMISIVQLFAYSFGLYVYKEEFRDEPVIVLKSHLEGCGMTTGWSPFFWLFFLAKLPLPERVRKFVTLWRDALTYIDYYVSLPGVLVLNIISLITLGKYTVPRVKHVDRLQVHH